MVGRSVICLVGWLVGWLGVFEAFQTESNQTVDLILIFTIISDKQTISSNNNNVSKVIIRQNELKTHRLNLKLHTGTHTHRPLLFLSAGKFCTCLEIGLMPKTFETSSHLHAIPIITCFFLSLRFSSSWHSQPSEARTKPENWPRCSVRSR